MGARKPSRRRVEEHPSKDVGGQLLLSLGFLEGLLPIGGRELENAVVGPARQEAEEIAEVGERLDLVEPGAGEQRDEDGVDAAGIGTSEEQPISAIMCSST